MWHRGGMSFSPRLVALDIDGTLVDETNVVDAATVAAVRQVVDAGVPVRDAQILARHADPRTTEHDDRARGNLDRHGVHSLVAHVAGV